MANEAADNGAQMIVFPEMCLTGYAMEQGDMKRADRMQIRLAETETGPSASVMTKLARDRSVYIVYGYPERIGSDKLNVYNSAFVAGPDGYLGSYRKIHPFGSEVIWCKTGTEPFSFDTPWGPMGISICYDTYNYSELGRYYGALGCRMILNPTATSWAYYSNKNLKNGKPLNNGFPTAGNNTEWVNRFKSRVEAVVVQSGLFVASSDLAGAEYDARGTFMGTCFPGGSCVVGPLRRQARHAHLFRLLRHRSRRVRHGRHSLQQRRSEPRHPQFLCELHQDRPSGRQPVHARPLRQMVRRSGGLRQVHLPESRHERSRGPVVRSAPRLRARRLRKTPPRRRRRSPFILLLIQIPGQRARPHPFG